MKIRASFFFILLALVTFATTAQSATANGSTKSESTTTCNAYSCTTTTHTWIYNSVIGMWMPLSTTTVTYYFENAYIQEH